VCKMLDVKIVTYGNICASEEKFDELTVKKIMPRNLRRFSKII